MERYVLDTETTGVDCKKHEITEIAIIRCKDLVQKTWNVKIKYPENCDKKALEVTRTTPQQLVSRGKHIEEVIPMVNAFLDEDKTEPKNRIIIAHNAPFDERFVSHYWNKSGFNFPAYMWCCTLAMSRKYNKLNGLDKAARLEVMLVKLGIKHNPNALHGSTIDTQQTYKLHKKFLELGVNELEFVYASKYYANQIKEQNEANIDEDDAALAEALTF